MSTSRETLARLASLVAGAALALAPRQSGALVQLKRESDGRTFVALDEDEMRALTATFAQQRARIAELERRLEALKASNGCA